MSKFDDIISRNVNENDIHSPTEALYAIEDRGYLLDLIKKLGPASRAVLTEYEQMLDSGDCGTSSNWRDDDKGCKNLHSILKKVKS